MDFPNHFGKLLCCVASYPTLYSGCLQDVCSTYWLQDFQTMVNEQRDSPGVGAAYLFRLSWKWRERSTVKIMERTREKDTEALHSRREGRRSAAAFTGAGANFQAL